jgi:hypothetical protein
MKPETNTVQQLFERDVRYNVPLYQRPYVWEQKSQWAPLWDDVSTLLEHDGVGSEMLSHFLGAIVLDQDRTNPGEIPRYTVIDGQQRLTTLQILLAAGAAAAAKVGAADDSGLLRDLVLNDPRKAKGVDQLKVWPTNADRDAFIATIAPSDVVPSDTPHRTLIDEAFAYFTTCVMQYLEGVLPPVTIYEDDADESFALDLDDGADAADAGSPALRAARLRIVLCDLLKIVSITLGEDDNAQVIFETLNARGTPLLALDLVKNVLFHQATRQHADTDELYYGVWQPQLDDEYWRTLRRQGRLNRPQGDLFLVHWLTMRLRDVIPATELFSTFRQRVLTPATDAPALVRTLCADAATLRSFDGLAEEVDFFARLPALDANVVLPIALLLYRSPELTAARRDRALRILESWLARRALSRLTAKNYNRQVPRLIDKMTADLAHADDVLLAALRTSEGEISRWPTDDDLGRFLLGSDVYGVVSRPRLVMALSAVEASLYSSKTDLQRIPDTLTLEHLMPQEWDENWPLVDDSGVLLAGDAREEAAEARNRRVHRLGNLTLVTAPLNSSMSNAGWDTKRLELNRHSRLLLNSRLDDIGGFTDATIDARGAWLVSRILEIWPGPDSNSW